ncbi:VCBS repeat-containing protein [Aliifodinibius sp. S!AR15-10]|uniref:VCBS repeat-containing protein n=1 Tax=Aliifodinibius sp. S!AR15-10 TaxID=2950437 RepID=UPI002855B9D6|nr:FG-GAP-like repeat-containing protein [Aliifodinibius sp. S!AR15-10]MDR8392430.1 VCBS repeat-containing protein [Aliifodinibius sp. S!AR15-10]
MYKKIRNLSFLLICVLIFGGCTGDNETPLFKRLSSDQTGVSFNNVIQTNDTLNIHHYPFLYNGAGVGVGDINNDGLPDIYFAGNLVTSRLYLNHGDMQFEDITESAGVETSTRASGVSMVDINTDGLLDIYVSVAPLGNTTVEEQGNLLFINNGDNTFTESAAKYNVAGRGYTTHSAFFDYDRDGDLDLYLLNSSPADFVRNEVARNESILLGQTSASYDQLLRNNGDETFTNVTREAGILRKIGFGLGVAISDINRDGWPDIYISNDILPDDVLYINNQDGSFSDKTKAYLKHTSFAGMGVDIADFNNDLWPDILQADMMPESYTQKKRITGADNYDHFTEMRSSGFHYQYNFNTLQLSNGIKENGDLVFSEIARLAGVARTHWSWSALFGDYDNDGFKDIMITNGYLKATNDFDYIEMMNNARQFGSPDIVEEREKKALADLYSYELPNYVYQNNGNLTFTDKSEAWALDDIGYSYGASQADLDNDGDLDMVINNLEGEAFIYQNQADTLSQNHFLSIRFKGPGSNPAGIGAQVVLTQGGEKQHQYFSPYRGFASTMDQKLIFGLGKNEMVDSLEVVWPDGRYQLLTGIAVDQELILDYGNATKPNSYPLRFEAGNKLFANRSGESGLEFQHQENEYNDYATQPLLPHQLSKMGPALATGDINGDGLEDIYIGGATGQAGAIFFQQSDGSFTRAASSEPWTADAQYEDVDATLFDADGDGDLDLYVASGGYEFSPASDLLQDRLYYNAGDGEFIRNHSALPMMFTSSGTVSPGDVDGDGDLDLFVGGRLVPGRYPEPAKSYLLRNDGGSFSDVTSTVAPDLVEPGMITDAIWSDFNGDGQLDLVTTGIWQPVRFYKNNNGKFTEVTESKGMASNRGWWYSIEAGDFDNDGDLDFIAGNLGQNSDYPADEDEKFEVFADDFDGNQSVDLLFAVEQEGNHIPYQGRAKFEQGISGIRYLFKTYQAYAEAEVKGVIGSGGIRDALHYQVDSFASVYIENPGNEEPFIVSELPVEVQFSSIQDMISRDINSDGYLDLIIAGNLYESEPETERNDAGNGLVLLGDGTGNFRPVSPFQSGFIAPLNARKMGILNSVSGEGFLIVVANNDGPVQLFTRQGQLNDHNLNQQSIR